MGLRQAMRRALSAKSAFRKRDPSGNFALGDVRRVRSGWGGSL